MRATTTWAVALLACAAAVPLGVVWGGELEGEAAGGQEEPGGESGGEPGGEPGGEAGGSSPGGGPDGGEPGGDPGSGEPGGTEPGGTEPGAEPASAGAAPGPADDDSETVAPTKRRISDFVATRLTFYVGDDNVLAGNADRSPNLGMGREYPELFFEGLNAQKGKVVNETNLVLYGKAPGFLPFLDTEAAFVAEFELTADPDDARLVGSFADDGSWLQATFWLGERGGKSLKLTAWPFSANRFRLGFLYDLTWGGDRMWARNRGPVPGVKLTLDLTRFYAFFGAKSLVRLRADNNETESYWGVLGGLGPNVPIGEKAVFAYDVNGGYFSRGTFQQDPHRSVAVVAFGASHRLSFGVNERMGASADLRLMTNDPDDTRVGFQASNTLASIPSYRGAFGLGVAAEFSTIWGSLIDADDPSARVYDDAITAALTARVRFLKSMRVALDLVYRDVSFLVLNVPGLTPYVSFATDTLQKPQIYGAVTWDWYIETLRISPAFVVGLMQPASFAARPDAQGERQVQVIREANDYELMPTGEQAFSILALKASLRWHLSPMLALAGEVAFTQDYNNTRVRTDPATGVGVRELDEKAARQLGLNLFMQAAF